MREWYRNEARLKPKTDTLDSMWPYPKIVAHRGGGTLAPENTLAAMRCARRLGFRAVEFDVMLAGDGIPVVIHDVRLGRTVRGAGSVPDYTAAELGAMDAGAWFSQEFAGEPVPTFEQVAGFCMAHGIWMNVEIKPAPGFEQLTGRVVAETAARLFARAVGPGDQLPLLSSFSFDAMLAAQRASPALPRAWLVERIPPDWQDGLRTLTAAALHTNHKNLSPAQAVAVKQAGYGLFCYTVNEPSRAREIVEWGVDAFCTDRLDQIGPDFM